MRIIWIVLFSLPFGAPHFLLYIWQWINAALVLYVWQGEEKHAHSVEWLQINQWKLFLPCGSAPNELTSLDNKWEKLKMPYRMKRGRQWAITTGLLYGWYSIMWFQLDLCAIMCNAWTSLYHCVGKKKEGHQVISLQMATTLINHSHGSWRPVIETINNATTMEMSWLERQKKWGQCITSAIYCNNCALCFSPTMWGRSSAYCVAPSSVAEQVNYLTFL